jgi:hypothetical protein
MPKHKTISLTHRSLIEPLEARLVLSTGYSVLDLSTLIPGTTGDNFRAANITATGLVALNNASVAPGSGNVGYVYSVSRRRIYSSPNGEGITRIAGNGALLLGNTIDFDGQMHTVPQPTSTANEIFGLTLTSINDNGQAAGTLNVSVLGDPQGGTEFSQSEVFNPDGSTLINLPYPANGYDGTIPPVINDAGQVAAYSTTNDSFDVVVYDHAAVYNLQGQQTADIGALFAAGTVVTATDINDNGIVVGSYAGPHHRNGVFSYNTATQALNTISTGEAVVTNVAIGMNGDVVGTEQIGERVRKHTEQINQAVIFNSADGIKSLGSMVPAIKEVTFTSAVGVDSSGDILAEGTDSTGAQHVYALEPKS